MNQAHFNSSSLPLFSDIDPSTIQSQISSQLQQNRKKIDSLLSQAHYTFENLMQPLEEMQDELSKTWSPISHLHSVKESDALRNAYNETLPLLTDYHTELSQNETLFKAISAIANNPDFNKLNPAQKKIIENDLRDFKLAGIHLDAAKKSRLAELQKQLSQSMTKFSENLLDATHAWYLHVKDAETLTGLPAQALKLAEENAKHRNLDGYVITLDMPSYSTAVKFLHDRELRKKLYRAYTTRASDQGPHAGKWDNSAVMENILQIRHEMANITGFTSYAHYSLATKMAKSPEEVLNFLHDLLSKSKLVALQEFKELTEFAQKIDGISELFPWDIAYYSEKLLYEKYYFNQEDLRPYFPIDHVLNGLFTIVNTIYGLKIQKEEAINVWHPHVEFYSILDDKNELRGGFYIDLYARPHKRDGAWMDDCRTRRRLTQNTVQYPVAYLTCNFMQPIDGHPALLTHDDVLTLFHEFGHCLHHLLTEVDYPSVAGTNGVLWDAIEFPSQFMEYYCWEKESLALIAAHYQTGKGLPDTLYKKMFHAKNFQTGLQMIRQLEFALFDFRLHLEYDPAKKNQIQTILNEVRKEAAVIPIAEFNRFQHSFSHVFAGSYAAGYYSYKWAEVLSADAYAEFEEKGIFNRTVGESFMTHILETGGVNDPMQAFIAFRGKRPSIDALLKQSGIAVQS